MSKELLFFGYAICLSLEFERLGGLLDQMMTISVHKYNVTMLRRNIA